MGSLMKRLALLLLFVCPAFGANEIGLFTATPPAAAFGVFTGEGYANIAPAGLIYTAPAGTVTLTRIRVYGRISGGGTIDACLYTFSGGIPVTRVLCTAITLTASDAWVDSSVLSQAMSTGVAYTLAIGNASAIAAISSVTQTSGMSYSNVNPGATWTNSSTNGNNVYLSGDITVVASSTVVNPTKQGGGAAAIPVGWLFNPRLPFLKFQAANDDYFALRASR